MSKLKEQFIVNIGGRNDRHYAETRPIAEAVAQGMRAAQEKLGNSAKLFGKNGGLTGSMQAFGEAYEAQGIDWVPVLTPELDKREYSPAIARNNPRKLVMRNNTERLAEIIKNSANTLLIVTTGGTGTLEEISSALSENEFRIKWPKEATGKPYPIRVVGDAAVGQWRPILQQVFSQLSDTHPLVERSLLFISIEYIEKGFLAEEIARITRDP